MKITGYKIVYDIKDSDGKSTHEVQAFDLPEYVREEIDHYFNFMEEEEDNCDWLDDIGDLCTSCRNDTSEGSGRFVNRIPSTTETAIGYVCEPCYHVDDSEIILLEEEN